MDIISHQEMEKIVNLAFLELTEEEWHEIRSQFGDILDYVNQIKKVLVVQKETVKDMQIKQPLQLRADKYKTFSNIQQITDNAPKFDKNYFKVKKIL